MYNLHEDVSGHGISPVTVLTTLHTPSGSTPQQKALLLLKTEQHVVSST